MSTEVSLRLGLGFCVSLALVGACAEADPPVETTSGLGQTRTYFIAADEVVWDYAPTGKNQITGLPFDEVANVFVANGPDRIGHRYIKALYREYTSDTFTDSRPNARRWTNDSTGSAKP